MIIIFPISFSFVAEGHVYISGVSTIVVLATGDSSSSAHEIEPCYSRALQNCESIGTTVRRWGPKVLMVIMGALDMCTWPSATNEKDMGKITII
jgi:hypothetical protein